MYSVTRLMHGIPRIYGIDACKAFWLGNSNVSGCRKVTWLEVKSYFRAQYQLELLTCSLELSDRYTDLGKFSRPF